MLLVLESVLREETPRGSVFERCFLLGGKELPWKRASEAFARSLHAEGVVAAPEARSVTLAEAGEGELPMLMASDMRFVSPRARRLGYKNEEVDLETYLNKSR